MDLCKSFEIENWRTFSMDRHQEKKANKSSNLNNLLSLTKKSKAIVVEEKFAMQDLNLDNTVDYSLTPLNRSPAGSEKNSVRV